jgi:hypothetical protein
MSAVEGHLVRTRAETWEGSGWFGPRFLVLSACSTSLPEAAFQVLRVD